MHLRTIIPLCLLLMVMGCSADDPSRSNTFVPLTGIEVTAAYEAMAAKTVNQYRAIGDFSGRFTRDITAEVSWRIENNEIASVSNNTGSEGLVTALAPGETVVSATFEDIVESAPVVVTDAFLTAIEIIPQDVELEVDVSQQYEAAGTFSDDSSQDITSLVTWESSDSEVAPIDSTGLAIAKAIGSTTISGTWQDITGSTSLMVSGVTLTEITISPQEATVARGTTVQFTAEGIFSDGSTDDEFTDDVDWQSSDNTIAEINEAGLATGVASGDVEISASFESGGETISATAQLTVTDAVLEAIIVTPENSTLTDSDTLQFKATGFFSDDSEQDITELAAWFNSNSNVGTISNTPGSRGLFVSDINGSTVIEATFGQITGETELQVRR